MTKQQPKLQGKLMKSLAKDLLTNEPHNVGSRNSAMKICLQKKESSRGVNVLENEKLKRMVGRNLTTTVRKLAEELGVSGQTVFNYLKAINIRLFS
uniref:HTH_11 domain-containing protein n=1 Tax=Strongyloides papillosus TaxID=174720 RepID=A0A0N5CBW2_STREA